MASNAIIVVSTTIYWQLITMNMLKTITRIEAYVLYVWETALPLNPSVSYCRDVRGVSGVGGLN